MRWGDARVVTAELLCAPGQADGLLGQVRAALGEVERAYGKHPGRWRTEGIRLRPPRTPAEHEWMLELLGQPDAPLAADRRPMVLEVGGRGASRHAEDAADAIGRLLCPEEFHSGPCRIPWSTAAWGMRGATRAEKAEVRELFRRGRGPS
jgi:hypothetical protein